MALKKICILIAGLCLFACAAMPAEAFTVKSLTMTLAPDGYAQVDMQYDLTLFEEGAIFFRISDPATELKKAFDSNSQYPVTVTRATGSSAKVLIPSFASSNSEGDITTMVTPSLSFEKAQRVLDHYWFAPLISPDFSPDVTTIIFPDGYQESFYNLLVIPSVPHQLAKI
jgi:methyl coenzyme M reductase subunit C